jgi:GNAT superfamily N-acetyltransferase
MTFVCIGRGLAASARTPGTLTRRTLQPALHRLPGSEYNASTRAAEALASVGEIGPEIRRASPDDRAAVVATITAAFRDDPAWRFLTDGRYPRLAPWVAGALFDVRVGTESVWVTEDVSAVAMWDAPAKSEGTAQLAEAVWGHYRTLAGSRALARLETYNAAVAAASSPTPHWYLGTLATHPAHQRQGLATAILEPVLRLADRAHVACCLETSTEANRRFYERRGFTEQTDVRIPTGPQTWWLRRPPSRKS